MADYILPLEKLIEAFRKLPGVGRKSAERYALAIVEMSDEKALSIAHAMLSAKKDICRCNICNNLSEEETCPICRDLRRENIICVVEDIRSVSSIEKTNAYRGKYHVLGGALSPVRGVSADDLKIGELLSRISNENIEEIIIATNPTVEGEATAMYLTKLIKPFDIKITRLAYGVPVGSDIEYADSVTLSRALGGRTEM